MPLMNTASMAVTESVDALRVAYVLSAKPQHSSERPSRIHCGPRDLVHFICLGRGLACFPCPRHECSEEMAKISGDIVEDGSKSSLLKLRVRGNRVYRYDGPELDTIGRIAGLLLNLFSDISKPEDSRMPKCLFSDSGCVDCILWQISKLDIGGSPLII
ncbi:uncharacterized protein BDV17DRAFT_260802 [Aspergillus undulatus]|uniref:uncharacterized protein n=1 Tax=Aspergillus undulatus TaxID=1810928 RepID=UPI003CCE392D